MFSRQVKWAKYGCYSSLFLFWNTSKIIILKPVSSLAESQRVLPAVLGGTHRFDEWVRATKARGMCRQLHGHRGWVGVRLYGPSSLKRGQWVRPTYWAVHSVPCHLYPHSHPLTCWAPCRVLSSGSSFPGKKEKLRVLSKIKLHRVQMGGHSTTSEVWVIFRLCFGAEQHWRLLVEFVHRESARVRRHAHCASRCMTCLEEGSGSGWSFGTHDTLPAWCCSQWGQTHARQEGAGTKW